MAGVSGIFCPAVLEWDKYRNIQSGIPDYLSFPTIADQPLEIAIQFDYLVNKYPDNKRGGSHDIFEEAKRRHLEERGFA